MNEWSHCKSSAAKWQGLPEDYLQFHSFLDQSKNHFADLRHRSLLHNTFGIHLAEQVFGITMTNSSGKEVAIRNILEQHIIEDLGRIPSVQDFLVHMTFAKWMAGLRSHGK